MMQINKKIWQVHQNHLPETRHVACEIRHYLTSKSLRTKYKGLYVTASIMEQVIWNLHNFHNVITEKGTKKE